MELWEQEKAVQVDLVTAQNYGHGSAAALTFLMWDIFITFDDEVAYVWSRKWSPVAFAYLAVRYFSPLAQLLLLLLGPNSEWLQVHQYSQAACRIWNLYQAVVSTVTLIALEVILVARVIALYQHHTNIRRLIHVLFGIEIICMIIGLSLGIPKYTFDRICLVQGHPALFRIYSSTSIGFQTFLFVLTLVKFVKEVKADWGRMPLAVIIVRDGTWAFLLFLSIQSMMYYITGPPYRRLLYPWVWSVCSFCGYRVFLNLRKFAEQELDHRLANIPNILATNWNNSQRSLV